MTASRSARGRRAAAQAGPLSRVSVEVGSDDQLVYKITCSVCTGRHDKPWSAYRPGEDNGYMAAMDRWTFHLVEKHPGEEAPCLSFLEEAQQRLQERRDGGTSAEA